MIVSAISFRTRSADIVLSARVEESGRVYLITLGVAYITLPSKIKWARVLPKRKIQAGHARAPDITAFEFRHGSFY